VGYIHGSTLFVVISYGEDGWHLNILLNGVVLQDVNADLDDDHAEEFERHRKHHNVTNGYRLQH
jgi:hypothetical protein